MGELGPRPPRGARLVGLPLGVIPCSRRGPVGGVVLRAPALVIP